MLAYKIEYQFFKKHQATTNQPSYICHMLVHMRKKYNINNCEQKEDGANSKVKTCRMVRKFSSDLIKSIQRC